MRSYAVIPAAGRSLRMGQHKLLLPWNGATVLQRVLEVWLASRVSRVVLVVRPDDAPLRSLLESLAPASPPAATDSQPLSDSQPHPSSLALSGRWEVVVPDGPPPEMKDSVLLGLRHVAARYRPDPEDVWLLAPADMPRFRSTTIDRLLQAHRAEEPRVLQPVYQGRKGHPVLLPWPLAAEVERLPAGSGIRDLVAAHPAGLVECGDPSVLEDLDTPADYARLRPRPGDQERDG